MNKQIFEQVGVTEEDFKLWCKENNKPTYKPEIKQEFFDKIQNGLLVKDSTGKIIKKD